jgi:hypothetical protein
MQLFTSHGRGGVHTKQKTPFEPKPIYDNKATSSDVENPSRK